MYTDEIDRYYITKGTQSDNAIEIRDGSFYWDLDKKEDKDKKDGKKEDKKEEGEKEKEKAKEDKERKDSDVINTS